MTAGATAMELGLQRCETCTLVSRPAPGEHDGRCPRCGEELTFRKPDSLQRTWAFLIAAAICYVPANLLPVLTTHTAAGADSDTILQGVVLLWSPTLGIYGWDWMWLILAVFLDISHWAGSAYANRDRMPGYAPA